MRIAQRPYKTNYWLLASAWIALFILFAFWFRGYVAIGVPNDTIVGTWKLIQSGTRQGDNSDLRDAIIRHAVFNGFVAALLCWPLHASIIALWSFLPHRGISQQSRPPS
jgi:hypothetical protein